MKKIGFILSHLIFEKLFKKQNAQELGESIKKEVDHSNKNRKSGCAKCSGKLNNKIIGTGGIIGGTETIYKCIACGHEQKSYCTIHYSSLIDKLDWKRIKKTKDGNYRYKLLTYWDVLGLVGVSWGIGIIYFISLA